MTCTHDLGYGIWRSVPWQIGAAVEEDCCPRAADERLPSIADIGAMSRFEELCMFALALAGGTMYVLNQRWPEHPIEFMDFLVLWAIMLIAIHVVIAIWGRMRRR
jgi:hypothetical protein